MHGFTVGLCIIIRSAPYRTGVISIPHFACCFCFSFKCRPYISPRWKIKLLTVANTCRVHGPELDRALTMRCIIISTGLTDGVHGLLNQLRCVLSTTIATSIQETAGFQSRMCHRICRINYAQCSRFRFWTLSYRSEMNDELTLDVHGGSRAFVLAENSRNVYCSL
jgi:hypothetical protein